MPATHSAGLIFNVADTRGIRNDMRIILYDGTNFEDHTVASFITGTSVTIKLASATVVDANVTNIFFYGFHTIKTTAGNSTTYDICAFEYEKLPLSESSIKKMVSRNKKLESVTVNFKSVGNNDDLYYPFFSDGTQGSWGNSSIDVTAKSSTAQSYALDSDLKNITISTGNMDFKITSTKEVYEDIDGMEKF